MAKSNLLDSSAMETVFSNLDMDPNDLGAGNDPDGDDFGGDDKGSGKNKSLAFDVSDEEDDDDDADPFSLTRDELDDDEDTRGLPKKKLDDLRVTHTDKNRLARPFPKKAEVKPDQKGNLVNAEGKIVAKAGTEARLYQDARKARQTAETATLQIQNVTGRLTQAVNMAKELHTEVEKYKAHAEKIKEFGLEPNDQITAFQLFLELKNDPAKAIKTLLTRAAARGIVIDNVGSSSVDTKSLVDTIKEVLGKELNPLKERSAAEEKERKTQQEQQQAAQAVQKEVQTFFAMNQDAVPYAATFQRILSNPQYAHMSLGEVWARIQLNLERRQRTNGRPNQRSRTPNQGSRPTGRSAPPSGNSEMASVNSSYDDILKDVLAEADIR